MMISLTGFMGCGKSSVGRRLSELLCCPFMDLDAVIEERAGRSIPEIFTTDGEAAFRRMELEMLRNILEEAGKQSAPLTPSHSGTAGPSPIVLALGGGTVMTPECAELVHDKTLCIYLKASLETLVSHLESEASGRPLLSGTSLRDRISELMAQRSSTYERTAHFIIDTDGLSIDGIAQTLATKIISIR